MKNEILNLWIVILLSACAAEAQPAQSTSTATTAPIETRTSTPIAVDPLETDILGDLRQDQDEPTQTPEPTPQPTHPPIPENYLACSLINSLGELAGKHNGGLWVEDEPGSGDFSQIIADANCPWAWSPDGKRLLFTVSTYLDDTEYSEFWVWHKDTQIAKSLKEIVPNLPTPYPADFMHYGDFEWSPDGNKLLFYQLFSVEDMFISYVVADLQRGKATWTEASDPSLAHGWLGSEYIYERSHCGVPCEGFTLYHYTQMEPISGFHAPTLGAIDVSDDGSLVLNIGIWGATTQEYKIELLHVSTGGLEMIGQGSVVVRADGYYPKLSPDNELIAYPVEAGECVDTIVINRGGEKIVDFSCASPVSWVSNTGVIAFEHIGTTPLTYFPLDGSKPQPITPEGYFVDYYRYEIFGVLSPDNRYYLFEAHDVVEDGEQETLALFVWDGQTGETRMIDSSQDKYSLYYQGWMPDSQSFYYKDGFSFFRYYPESGARAEVVPVFKSADAELEEATPTPTPVPEINFCGPELSNKGLLAFVQADVLKVETEAGSGKFVPVARNALCSFGWSPDGSKLLYSIGVKPGDMQTLEYWLWDANALTVQPLYEAVPAFGEIDKNVHFYGEFEWSPDSKKIIFKDLVPSSEAIFDNNTISVLDLEAKTLKSQTDLFRVYDFGWINSDYFYFASSCGSPCVFLAYYKHPQMSGKSAFAGITTGNFGIAPNGTFVVNFGKFYSDKPVRTVERLDVYTGQVTDIWEFPPETSPFVDTPPLIAPDNQTIALWAHVDDAWQLYVFDRTGESIAQLNGGGTPITWKPGGGILVSRYEDESYEIVYWPVTDSAMQVILPGEDYFALSDNIAWSRNGRYLLLDLGQYLYLWDAQSEAEAQLISTDVDGDFAWMPDSGSFYYATDGVLWRYFVESGEIKQVTP